MDNNLDRWQQDVQEIWDQGNRQQAIDLLLQRINSASPELPRLPCLQFVYYLFLLGDLASAEVFLRQMVTAYPEDAEILENLGVVINRQGKEREAIPFLERAAALRPTSVNVWDGLASSRFAVGDLEGARRAGEEALELKNQSTRPLSNWSLPAISVQEFLVNRSDQHTIAFSLWGSNPRYLRGAMRNLLLIPEIYPGWRARFYLDGTVPTEFIDVVQQLGGEIRLQPDGQTLRQKLCWRFQVVNDPDVGRFMIRDCDSVVSLRERHAVDEWLKSDRYFHVMRDWWTHTDPVLAGMWGGVAGVLPNVSELLMAYTPGAKETPNIDQWFLRDCLWDGIRRSVLVHDRCYRSDQSQPWPDPDPTTNFHVGQNEYTVHREMQEQWLQPWIDRFDWLRLSPSTNPSNDTLLPRVDPDAVWRRFDVLKITQDRSEHLDRLEGYYINLAAATERRYQMEKHLLERGFSPNYQRFGARTATLAEARERGLKTAGELGLWRSTLALLEQICSQEQPAAKLFHLLEDDAIIHPDLPAIIEQIWDDNAPWDILFAEAFVSVDLYRKLLVYLRQRKSDGELLVVNGGYYLACTSSYLISPLGARKLYELLKESCLSPKLEPIDMEIRKLIRSGKLKAGLCLPFLSTIVVDIESSIQTDKTHTLQRSQNADLYLRRLLYLDNLGENTREEFNNFLDFFGREFSPAEQQELAALLMNVAKERGFISVY